MSKLTSRRRLNRIFLMLAIAGMLVCFVSQAQAAVSSGLAKVKGACSPKSLPHNGMKHPGCCGPKCCCDVQQDNTPGVPAPTAFLAAPAGAEGESLLPFSKPHPGVLKPSLARLQCGMVRYLPAGPVYLSPLNLLC